MTWAQYLVHKGVYPTESMARSCAKHKKLCVGVWRDGPARYKIVGWPDRDISSSLGKDVFTNEKKHKYLFRIGKRKPWYRRWFSKQKWEMD